MCNLSSFYLFFTVRSSLLKYSSVIICRINIRLTVFRRPTVMRKNKWIIWTAIFGLMGRLIVLKLKNCSKMVNNWSKIAFSVNKWHLDGDYLVRSSTTLNYALTVRWNSSSFHFLIIKQGSKWILDDDKLKFESIPSLIQHYVKTKEPVSKLSQALLIKPINSRLLPSATHPHSSLIMQSTNRKIILPPLKNKALGRVIERYL